jgi:SAM-dependent methyltransferase
MSDDVTARPPAITLLSTAQTAAYWDSRHAREGGLRSGGNIGFDEATNEMFYVARLELLMRALGHLSDPVAPLFLLDAGCGKGWFSRQLTAFGHQIDGIDASPSAINYCRVRGGGARYFRSTLDQWRSPWLYDAVVSIDVLFHILDHEEWQSAVRNLASLVRFGGRLIVSDTGQDCDRQYGNYQVVRGRSRYLPLASQCGLRFEDWLPYHFRGSFLGFYVFTRVA